MNPFTPFKYIAKSVVLLVTMPFMLMGLLIHGIAVTVAWTMTLAMSLTAIIAVAAAFAALVLCPLFMIKNARSNHEQRMSIVEQFSDGTVVKNGEFCYESTASGPRDESIKFRFVGPGGDEIVINSDELNEEAFVDENDVVFDDVEVVEDGDDGEKGDEVEQVDHVDRVAEEKADAVETSASVAESGKPASDAERAIELAKEALENAPPLPPIPPQERPEWVDEIIPTGGSGSRLIVKSQQCESAQACEIAYQDAMAAALRDYVRVRAEICLFDLGLATMPWHDITVQRIAKSLRIHPQDEYLETHDTNFGGTPLRTYMKYGLLEISPAMRDHIDGEVTRWARSFQAASYWGILMSSVAGLYLFVKLDLPGRVSRRWHRRKTNSSAAVA